MQDNEPKNFKHLLLCPVVMVNAIACSGHTLTYALLDG